MVSVMRVPPLQTPNKFFLLLLLLFACLFSFCLFYCLVGKHKCKVSDSFSLSSFLIVRTEDGTQRQEQQKKKRAIWLCTQLTQRGSPNR